MRISPYLSLTGIAIATLLIGGCDTVVDTRIPSMPVAIDLSMSGIWHTYGVSGYGDFQYFVYQTGQAVEPTGFSYNSTSATGYGGVLLIEGMDPYTLETLAPLAYDLSCPVERSRIIRVYIDPETYEAVCPDCHSHYDVTMGGGAPLSGPALTGERKYGLRRYTCRPTSYGGYYISDR